MANRTVRYGWLPDLPDHRDHLYQPSAIRKLPENVDLRPQCPPVLDQGTRIGSCTAHAVCNAFRFDLRRQDDGEDDFLPSRLFVHYNARKLEGTQAINHGAQIRDAFKSIAHQGVCHERLWPYIAKRFADAPPVAAYHQAIQHQALRYHRIAVALKHLKTCLAEGYPFVIGLTVYDDFESARMSKTGTLHLPKPKESLVGGHAVLVVGYDDKKARFLVMNSYGKEWGQRGYFTVPYDYIMHPHLAADCWTLRRVEA